jgi:hypothetical protein
MFLPQMIQAILAGRKTMTRRIVKPQPVEVVQWDINLPPTLYKLAKPPKDMPQATVKVPIKCPYGNAGDRLWVKEDFCCIPESDGGLGFDLLYADGEQKKPDMNLALEWERRNSHERFKANKSPWITFRKHPQFFMPRWVSRLNPPIINIRVERIQDISEADAIAEGVEPLFTYEEIHQDGKYCSELDLDPMPFKNYLWQTKLDDGRQFSSCKTAKESLKSLWTLINGAETWDRNVWVWVIEFEKVESK